jgi:hypothetical protein
MSLLVPFIRAMVGFRIVNTISLRVFFHFVIFAALFSFGLSDRRTCWTSDNFT